MKKFVFVFLFFIIYLPCVSNGTEQNNTNNTLGDSVQNLDIDTDYDLRKTKILFFEPCNVYKMDMDSDNSNAEAGNGDIGGFIDDNFTGSNNYYDRYSSMSPIQNELINKLVKNLEKNLRIVDLFDFSVETNSCGKIDDYISKNKTNIDDFVLNNYSENNDYVIVNNLLFTDEGKLKLELFIWDMLDRRIVGAQYYIINENTLTEISNIISDFVYVNTTDENVGIFNSKVMYVSETGKFNSRKKTIKTMNFNGDNNVKVTDGNGIIITPTFSKMNKNEIYYLEYRNKSANFFKEDITNGTKSLIKVNGGIMFAPSFNPVNNNQLVLSIAGEDGTNLFMLDVEAGKYSKITNNKFINTSPDFAPDGTRLVYVSDKSGVKKLYVYDVETKKSKKISKNSGAYDNPIWSPDDRLIAFIKMEGGKFKLGLMTSDGENERFITESYLIDGLKWSPNSRYIMFSKQASPYGKGSVPRLYIIDILTNREMPLNTPADEGAVDPDWIDLK